MKDLNSKISKASWEYATEPHLSIGSTGFGQTANAFFDGAKYVLGILNAVFIEKELLDPVSVNGYAETVGPYYHIYKINENLEREDIYIEKSGDIKEAARYAERNLDFDTLAVAYKENPDGFSSVSRSSSISSVMFPPNIMQTGSEETKLTGQLPTNEFVGLTGA